MSLIHHYLLRPSLYVQLKSRRSELEHMLFLRTEATYVPIRDDATAWATAGYKRTFITKKVGCVLL